MMQRIKNCKELVPYLKNAIEDEGIEIGIEDSLSSEN